MEIPEHLRDKLPRGCLVLCLALLVGIPVISDLIPGCCETPDGGRREH